MAESSLSPKADESVATGALMPLVSLRRHYKIGLSVCIAIILIGIPVAWVKGKALFYAVNAVIYVAPRVPNILQDNKEQEISSYQQYQQFVQQQAASIGRYDLLQVALKRLGDKRSLWQKPTENDRYAAERLQASLIIKPVKDTYLISVKMESNKAEGLDVILNTVVETYIENAHSEELIYASKERMEILYDQRNKLQGLITDNKKRLGELTQELSITIFVDATVNPFDQLLADSQLAFSKAQRERIAAEAGLNLFENPKDSKATEALDAVVADIVYKDQGLFSLKANMYQRRSELVRLISGLDPKHPGHEQIKKQLEVVESEVVAATNQLTTDVKHMLLEERRSKVTLTRKIEQDLLNQINTQKKNASWFSTRYHEGIVLNTNIKNLYERLKIVENRISFLELESKAPGLIRVESLARPAEIPIRGGRKKLLMMVLMGGIFAGLSIPIFIDMFDRRIRTAGQVEKLLGYKPLAALLEPDQPGASPIVMADQKRRMTLALERERKQSGILGSLIVVTSVKHQSAVTSLAMDLALDYQKMGVRSVVVEVNLLKPSDRYLSENNDAGFINLIYDQDLAISKVINPANDLCPDRIAVGVPTEGLLFDYERVQAVLTEIAETYPLVILDAAPVSLSADTEFFASISDITLLLIAAKQTVPNEIKRTVKILERVGPKVVSFVVTRLEIFRGGGYYASVHKAASETPVATPNFLAKDSKNEMMISNKTRLLYLLHSGNLYGTERMALVTLNGLKDALVPILMAPPGPVHEAARAMGIETHEFKNTKDIFRLMPKLLKNATQVAVCATGVSHSLLFIVWNSWFRLKNVHLHLVHGGTDERLSYGRKKILNHLPILLVAVSGYVQERLLAHGVRNQQIKVLENFLPDQQIANAPSRPSFQTNGVQKVLVISRVDPIKRIDVLLDALDLAPSLNTLEIRVLGTGWELEKFRERAKRDHPNVTFVGFTDQVEHELAASDLLLHLCPVEPFGLAILEAMAARVPVLLPDQGGAAGLIEVGVSGLHFKANDAQDLATKLAALQSASMDELNKLADNAHQRLLEHYSSSARLNDYRSLFEQVITS